MPRRPRTHADESPVVRARQTLLEGVGVEVASAFPGITRLGGQIVAALYLSDAPRSMDSLAEELGCSKSNIFTNLRGLESAGIVERRRETGLRHDSYALKGPYPDVIIGAYVSKLRLVVFDYISLSDRALELLGDAEGPEAESLRKRLVDLNRKYTLFRDFFSLVMPAIEGPIDLEKLLLSVPRGLIETVAKLAREAMRGARRWTKGDEG